MSATSFRYDIILSKGNYRVSLYYDYDIPAHVSIFFQYNDTTKICQICSKLKIKTPKRLRTLVSLSFCRCFMALQLDGYQKIPMRLGPKPWPNTGYLPI